MKTLLRFFFLAVSAHALLAQTPEGFSQALEAIRKKNDVPALAAASVSAGQVLISGACGVRKLGGAEKVTLEDRWHIGSCTKSMTATLAAKLVEEGVLGWKTTVGEVFPELRSAMAVEWRTVTLEQLLTHRAGAPHEPPPKLWAEAWKRLGTPTAQRLAFVRGLVAQKPVSVPGSAFLYSNQGYAIAGAMLERLTHKPWETLMRERLFEPLGMTSAGFGAPASLGKVDQPWGHASGAAGWEPKAPGPAADNPEAIGPGGTVHCSIGDLARYAGLHASGAGAKVPLVSAASFEHLHTGVPEENYAMGWRVLERDWAGGTTLMHNGTNTMFYAVMWVAPGKDAAFVAATNGAGPKAETACDEAVSELVQRFLKAKAATQ